MLAATQYNNALTAPPRPAVSANWLVTSPRGSRGALLTVIGRSFLVVSLMFRRCYTGRAGTVTGIRPCLQHAKPGGVLGRHLGRADTVNP